MVITGHPSPTVDPPPGNSVCARVHGFLPYFYVEAPHGFSVDEIAPFRTALAVSAAKG